MSAKREKRFSRILALLDEQERVDVEELAQFFEVSPETIRRDLSTMYEQGLLRKVHGGAVKFQSAQESPFALRTQQYAAQKTSIAQYAIRFVKPGDSLFINAGTTTTIFARELVKQIDELIIVTNSPQIAHEFYNNGQSRNKIHLIGGTYNGAEIETIGGTVVAEILRFRMDHAFITVGAVNAMMGYMDYRVEAADVTRTMVSRAKRTTVLADSSKLDQIALVSACSLEEVNRLVTDAHPSETLTAALQEAGAQLFITGYIR
jgi:DeoR/GlpR family transcriptional regulator of sugar metabolism